MDDVAAGGAAETGQERLEKALSVAYAHINRRERTVAEVRAQLERKGISEAVAEEVVRSLCEQHLLDDARFAEAFVADKRTLEQWGSERIRRGLHARGVDAEIAERALATTAGSDPAAGGWDDAESELDRALALLRRRFPDPPRDRRERDRALAVLLRKGYESELALDALAAHAWAD